MDDISDNNADLVRDVARVHAVERYRILDTPPDRGFARIAGLAARLFDAPMAAISIVDTDRIWFMAVHGLDKSEQQAAPDAGLCLTAILGDSPYVVEDALTDPRTADNRFVQAHQVRFYVGAPLVTFDGHRLGTVAVMDTIARTPSDEQLTMLEDLAAVVMEQLELRRSLLDSLNVERGLRDAAEYARDDAQQDRDSAEVARDHARLERDQAEVKRDDAELDRDSALRDRDFAEHDRDLIEEYASVLQRTLLPPSLPIIDGLTLSAHYHPASPREVGGDFYDVFSVGGNRWAFFIGDVEGHGADAAVATSLIRYTLRSLALHYSDPTEALAELNTVMLRESGRRRFCTVLLGTFEPHADGDGVEMTVATGGHPPALLLDPVSATVDPVRSRQGMLVGATPNATFHSCKVHLRRGQTLLFYTDGIIEAQRGPNAFDEEALAAFALERATLGAVGIVDELATLMPKLSPDDDIAVLAIQATWE
ncbi:MAG: GAF domain-containing SpoIIE family protein phosphatase [Mycobacterium sp.]